MGGVSCFVFGVFFCVFLAGFFFVAQLNTRTPPPPDVCVHCVAALLFLGGI